MFATLSAEVLAVLVVVAVVVWATTGSISKRPTVSHSYVALRHNIDVGSGLLIRRSGLQLRAETMMPEG